jgi:hypothetical protein
MGKESSIGPHYDRAIKKRLMGQKCVFEHAKCTEYSMCFSLKGKTFFIPKCPDNPGFTAAHLAEIETTLTWLELELLPLDLGHM